MISSQSEDRSATKKFAERFREACDASPNVPEYGKGRQVKIADEMGVSQEAVRKWFAGESMPKPMKMKKLAKYLEVEQSWLALGEKSESTREDRRLAGKVVDGSVMFVGGTFQLAGGNCAFPSADDPRSADVDIYVIIAGRRYDVNVAVAKEVTPNVYEFVIPREYETLRCIGYVLENSPQYRLLELSRSLIDKHKVRRSVDYVITVNKIDGRFYTGSDIWLEFDPLRSDNDGT